MERKFKSDKFTYTNNYYMYLHLLVNENYFLICTPDKQVYKVMTLLYSLAMLIYKDYFFLYYLSSQKYFIANWMWHEVQNKLAMAVIINSRRYFVFFSNMQRVLNDFVVFYIYVNKKK